MSIRGSLVIECDHPKCHAEIVLEARDFTLEREPRGTDISIYAYGWHMNDDDAFVCPQCAEPNPREKGDDDGVEYADPRDRKEGRE